MWKVSAPTKHRNLRWRATMRVWAFSLILGVASAFPNAWIPALSAQGVGRRGNWHSYGEHPWSRSGIATYNEKRRNPEYDLFDGVQGDDPSLWLGEEDESSELAGLEFDLPKAITQPPVTTETFEKPIWTPTTETYPSVAPTILSTTEEDIITKSLVNQVTESEIFQPRSRDRQDEWDSVERYFLHKAAVPLSNDILLENDLRSLKLSSSEDFKDKSLSRKTDSSIKSVIAPDPNGLNEISETSRSSNKSGRDALKAADYKLPNITSPNVKYLFTRKPQKEVTSKPVAARAFQVELHAAETIKRKLFRNNTRQRQNYLAPVDLMGRRRKNKEDTDLTPLSRSDDVEDVKLLDPTSIYYPLENVLTANESPVEVLKAVVRERRPNVPRPTTTPSVVTTEFESVAEDTTVVGETTEEATELPPSLADLFPTIPPPSARKGSETSHRVTRIPYYIKQQIIAKSNRRGRGREIIMPPDYSPLPYGIDYRAYDGPRSLLSKLRFQSESNDHLTTTVKPIMLNVPDLELSDTGRLNEIYRFVGRKPNPSTQRSTEISNPSTSASKAFESFINFFKSLIGRTTTPLPEYHY